MKAKLKPGFLIREVAGEQVLIPAGKDNVNFSKMMVLNDSAATLVSLLMEKECMIPEDLVNVLLSEYDVAEEQAKSDVEELISTLKELKVLAY